MSDPKYLSGDAAGLREFIAKFDTFLFDCDGVLWSGDHLLPAVAETLDFLREQGKKLVFVTNNSTKSRKDYAKKFEGFGISVTEEEVFCSSYSAAIYISRILNLPPNKNKVYLLSESGTEAELAAEGVRYIGGTDPALRRDWDQKADVEALASGKAIDPEVGAVLIGLDFHVNYLKMATALAYVQRGAVFLATNTDSTLPASHALFPGAGSVGAGVVKGAGKDPLSLGKPSQAMMQAIEGKFKLDRGRTCMIGDRLDTDIRFGIEGGLGGTLLVLTGVSKESDIIGVQSEGTVKPTVYLDKLGDLLGAK